MAKHDENYEFNPIKEQKGNEQAQRVIWSTQSIEMAVDAIQKGLPLKVNPFMGSNTKLLKPDLVYKRTEEEIADYIHCMQDPVYFASKCHIMTPEGLRPCKLRDYQVRYLNHLQNHRFSIFLSCRQSGKSVTTAIYCLWVILFNIDKNGLILSKSGEAGRDLLSKIKDMFLYLPYHLKCGVLKWNQTSISFDNNSSISTEAFSPTAGLGKTINFLILDEFAWCPPNEVELFYNNIIPTVTTISDSNVCIMSTQNGFNLFQKLYSNAVTGKNIYAPFKVDWYEVPQFDDKTKTWVKRDEAWKQMMVGVLGSEADFYYQYGTTFAASDKCIVNRNVLEELHKNELKFLNLPDLQKFYKETYNMDFELGITLLHPECLYFNPNYNLQNLSSDYIVILCDLAEGGGNDYTTFNIIKITEKDRFEQIGYWHSNKVNLELASLEFWFIATQLFNSERCMYSIEWNTYGQLFYTYLCNLNEPEYMKEYYWRFNVANELDTSFIVRYTMKFEVEENGMKVKKTKRIPGLKFTASNKITSCSLLKLLIENKYLIINDVLTISEIENFEDKNGNGSYAAAYGHDDIVMTLAQIPMLQQTAKYKEMCEEIAEGRQIGNDDMYNPYDSISMYNF